MSCKYCDPSYIHPLALENIPQKTRANRITSVYIDQKNLILETPYNTKSVTTSISFCPKCGNKLGVSKEEV